MEVIEDRINAFYDQWEYYCYPDKTEKCRTQVDDYLKEIDTLQEETGEGKKKQKAKLLYLKGKILDLLPAYEKSSEEFLNKSIKLNPTNGDCWNTLAHVLFKKGDIQSSQQAVAMALQHKGKNKVSLRYQSILLRCQGKNQEERRRNIEESLKVIKQGLMLDIKDPATWYFLGNAYFSNFIANFKKFDELQNALKAYNEAEKHFNCKYPDLYLNRANVQSHMEDYESAIKDYLTVEEIDSSIGCLQNVKRIRQRMEYTKTSFDRIGELKKARIQELVKEIPNSINNNKDNLEVASIGKLKQRANLKKLLTGKIIGRITNSAEIPYSFLAIDNEGAAFCLSLYNVNIEKISEKLQRQTKISVLNPEFKIITFQGFKYPSIQIFEPIKLRVNQNWLTKEEFNPTQVRNEAFEK